MSAPRRTLTQRDQAVLDLERTWWAGSGSKDHAIRDQLDMSRSQYYRLLAGLLDNEQAYDYDPLTIARLRRRRVARRKARIVGHVLRPGLR